MLNLLNNVGHAVGAVKAHKLCLLVDVGLVVLKAEQFPNVGKLHCQPRHRSALNVEITSVVPTAHGKIRNPLIRFVFCICHRTLRVSVLLTVVDRRL